MAYIPQEKLAFSCHLADHCNLRCKGCDNYSPAAPARFTNHEVFRRDLVRIREIFGNRVSSIQLLGGEPLFNPEIDRFLITARQIFTEADQTEISIVTNGVLLNAMPDHFWQTCREQAVVVRYTWYPIPVDYEAAVKKGSRFSVPVERYGRPGEEGKTLQFDPFDLTGSQDGEWNFRNCFHANKCIQVREGRIYTCNIRAFADIFCSAFGIGMELSPQDSLDLRQDLTSEQVMEFLSRPIPFCRYCNIRRRDDGHIWRTCVEAAEIHDWMLFRFDHWGLKALNRYDRVFFLPEAGEEAEFAEQWKTVLDTGLEDHVQQKVLPLPVEPAALHEALRQAGAGEADALVIMCQVQERRLCLEKAAVEAGYKHCYLFAQED